MVNNQDSDFAREKLARFLTGADEQPDDYLEGLHWTNADEAPANSSQARSLADKIVSLKERQDRYIAVRHASCSTWRSSMLSSRLDAPSGSSRRYASSA